MNKIKKLLDPKFYIESFLKIKGKTPGLIPFILNEAQKDFLNTFKKFNRMIVLKARQIGYSTVATAALYHRTVMQPGTNTAIIGYNSDLTSELLDKVKTFYSSTPGELRPTVQYNSKYEMSFPKLGSKLLVLPSTENVGRGYTLHNVLCLSGDTIVFGDNGNLIKIKNLKDGDFIVNGNGGKSKVKKVIQKKPDTKMLSIDTVGCINDLKLTENHEVLTRDGWKPAGVLKSGDYVGYPYFQLRNRFKEFDLSVYVKDEYKSRTKTGVLKYSRDFGEVCGWFAAEGSITPGRTIFSINKNEVDYLLPLLQKTVGSVVNKISVYLSKKSETATICVYSSPLSLFFSDFFGSGAANKTISDKVWYWGWDFGYGFLRGVFLGDGCLTNDRKAILVSISPSLVYQVKKLLVSLRIGLASINSCETSRYGVKNQTRYNLSILGPGNYKLRRKLNFPMPTYDNGRFRWIIENDPGRNYGQKTWVRGRFHYWMKIRSIKEIEKEDLVYDIVLEKEPHSFLTHSGVVHNCTELSSWEKADEKMMTIEASVPIEGKIIIESTPKGAGNLYHRMWVSDNDYAKREYGWWWMYTEEQIETIRRRMNDPQKFAQEYELTFLASGRMVFDSKVVNEMREHQLKVGDQITDEHGVVHIVREKNDWTIYKEPEVGAFYVVGADVAEGVTGGDYSVAVIFNRTTGEEVAMFRAQIAPDKFGEQLNEIGRYYNNALMAVEINNHGLTTVTILKQLLYPSMYFRPSKFETVASPWSDKLGWKTTLMTRNIMIDDIVQAIRDKDLLIHSKVLLDEMTVFVYDKNNRSGAMDGFHDDGVFALAIAFQAFKVMSTKPTTQLSDNHIPIFGGY